MYISRKLLLLLNEKEWIKKTTCMGNNSEISLKGTSKPEGGDWKKEGIRKKRKKRKRRELGKKEKRKKRGGFRKTTCEGNNFESP